MYAVFSYETFRVKYYNNQKLKSFLETEEDTKRHRKTKEDIWKHNDHFEHSQETVYFFQKNDYIVWDLLPRLTMITVITVISNA